MKKQATALLGVFISAVLLTGCSVKNIGVYREAISMDQQSKAYVDQVIPKLVQAWKPAVLFQEESDSLVRTTPPEKINAMLQHFAQKLGPLKQYEGASGQARLMAFKTGHYWIGSYHATGIFEKGDADLIIKVIQENNQWKLLFLQVNSEALTQNLIGQS